MAYSSDVLTFPCNRCPKAWTRFEHATLLHGATSVTRYFDYMFNMWPSSAIKMTKIKFCQIQNKPETKMTKEFKILSKWRNSAKSVHAVCHHRVQ